MKNSGENLFDVGKTKKENIQFLIFICAIIRGISKHSGLLRMTVASAGNDLRLGGSEAPPSTISIFLGKHLFEILEKIASGKEKDLENENLHNLLVTKATTLPNLLRDDSDRNRTSPFAFTGNKFEFRMLGASASISFSTTVLNLIVAESLEHFIPFFEKEKNVKEAAIKIISETIKEHKNIIKDTVNAAKEFIKKETIELFEHFNVLTKNECFARYEIMLENYCDIIYIEASTMIEMVGKEILPAILKYDKILSDSHNSINAACNLKSQHILNKIKFLTESVDKIAHSKNKLEDLLKRVKNLNGNLLKAEFCRDEIIKEMNNLRKNVDDVEQKIPKDLWKIPSITEILHKI